MGFVFIPVSATTAPSFNRGRSDHLQSDCTSTTLNHFVECPYRWRKVGGCYRASYGELLPQFDFDIASVSHRDVCDTVTSGKGDPFGTETQSLG